MYGALPGIQRLGRSALQLFQTDQVFLASGFDIDSARLPLYFGLLYTSRDSVGLVHKRLPSSQTIRA